MNIRKTSLSLTLVAMNGLAVLFLLVLMKGSSYGGIRHALPVVFSLALLGSLAIHQAIKSNSYIFRVAVSPGNGACPVIIS